MRLVCKQFFSITKLTALEASRQPVFLLLTTITIVFIGLLPLIITHVIGDSARMVRDSALAVQLLSGLLLGCYASTATITHELKKGTLSSIISKPVNRAVFFLAKFCGVALIMATYMMITTMATMLSARTAAVTFVYDWWGVGPLFTAVLLAYLWGGLSNYRKQNPFVSRAFFTLTLCILGAFILSMAIGPEGAMMDAQHGHDHGHHHGHDHAHAVSNESSPIPWEILPAGVLLTIAVILLCSFAVTLSLKLELIPTVSIASGVLILGLMSDYLFGQRIDEHWIYAGIYGLLPNWQHFWAIDAIGRAGIPWSYTLHAAAYAGAYAAVILSAGIATFYRMEMK